MNPLIIIITHLKPEASKKGTAPAQGPAYAMWPAASSMKSWNWLVMWLLGW